MSWKRLNYNLKGMEKGKEKGGGVRGGRGGGGPDTARLKSRGKEGPGNRFAFYFQEKAKMACKNTKEIQVIQHCTEVRLSLVRKYFSTHWRTAQIP